MRIPRLQSEQRHMHGLNRAYRMGSAFQNAHEERARHARTHAFARDTDCISLICVIRYLSLLCASSLQEAKYSPHPLEQCGFTLSPACASVSQSAYK